MSMQFELTLVELTNRTDVVRNPLQVNAIRQWREYLMNHCKIIQKQLLFFSIRATSLVELTLIVSKYPKTGLRAAASQEDFF